MRRRRWAKPGAAGKCASAAVGREPPWSAQARRCATRYDTVLGGEPGAEAQKHGAGGGVKDAADTAAHQQAARVMQPGNEHEQIGQAKENAWLQASTSSKRLDPGDLDRLMRDSEDDEP